MSNLNLMRQFVGWLSADIPELHSVEVPRLADSLDRFLKETSAPMTRDIRAEAEEMRERLKTLIANPQFADTRPVLEIRLETLDVLLEGPKELSHD